MPTFLQGGLRGLGFRGLYWSKALSNQLLASLFHSAPALSRSSVVVIAFIQADFLQLAVI